MDPFNRHEIDCYGFPPMHCLFPGLLFSLIFLFRLAGRLRLAVVNSRLGSVFLHSSFDHEFGYFSRHLTCLLWYLQESLRMDGKLDDRTKERKAEVSVGSASVHWL
ncbi:hypothetical protein MLD38_030478 [Melastoma candidum]|uniref:Uncharacterized protein n=1 Tax=Melastoma candidum TaxID=119954 RepID=A0ACB9MMD1_9MYRT|nr:hypothetical protein MLD38_030478 [Melastoma candidum]